MQTENQTYFKADAVSVEDECGINTTVRFWTASEDGYSLAAAFNNIRNPEVAVSMMGLWRMEGETLLAILSADRVKTPQEVEDAADRHNAELEIANALAVLVHSKATAAWLAQNDPKALAQAREALGLDDPMDDIPDPSDVEEMRVAAYNKRSQADAQTKVELRDKAEALKVRRGEIQPDGRYKFAYNGVEEPHQAVARHDGETVSVLRKFANHLWNVRTVSGADFVAFDYELLPLDSETNS